MPAETIDKPLIDSLLRRKQESENASVCVRVVAHSHYFNFIECLLLRNYLNLLGSP
jgi:hypothetical protein